MIAIYARVSTEEQAKHGFSLADQIRECLKKAETNDVIEYVDEGVSGEFLDRPALTKMRTDVREGLIHRVICLDPDRLSRKLMNQLILSDEIETRAELVFVNGDYARTPEGQLFYQMRGAISQFEKAKINERMSRGRREKARQGRVLRDFHIYGYDFNRDTEQFIVNPQEASVVQLIFDLFTNPQGRVKGINGIANYLTNHGIRTKTGNRVFHRQVVRQMLMNRAYIGEFYQNRWNTEGMLGNRFKPKDERIPQRERPKSEWIRLPIPAIIPETQFEYAQRLLEQSRRRWAGQSRETYLLSGLLRCGSCGNTLTGRRKKNWGTYVREYNDVKKTAGAKNPGCGVHIPCDELDQMVWDKIRSWATPSEEEQLNEEVNVLSTYEESELERIKKELERIKVGQSRLLNLLSDPDIDEMDIRQKLKEFRERKEQLLNQQNDVQEKIQQQKQKTETKNLLQEAWQAFMNLPDERVTTEMKQQLIRSVVREIRVLDRGKSIEIYTV